MEMTLDKFLKSLKGKTIPFYNELDVRLSKCQQRSGSESYISFDIMSSNPTHYTSNGSGDVTLTHENFNRTQSNTRFLSVDEQKTLINNVIEAIDTEYEDLLKRASVKNILDEINTLCRYENRLAPINTNVIKAMNLTIEDFCIALADQSFKYDERLNINAVNVNLSENEATGFKDYLFTITVSHQDTRFDVAFVGLDGIEKEAFDPARLIDKHEQFKILTGFVHAIDQIVNITDIDCYIEDMIHDTAADVFKIEH